MPRALYFWRETFNFGDQLAPIILKHFSGLDTTWAEPDQCDIVCVGSTLDILPQQGWSGTVMGSGKLLAETKINLTSASVLGLRGPLTLNDVVVKRKDRSNLVLGDPGLLVKEIVQPERNKYHLGCVPHCSDAKLYPRELARSRQGKYVEPILIDPSGDPLEVVKMIGSCRKIITSSLHGVITADAFGIPRRVEPFPAMFTNPHEGGFVKFADYGASIGQPIQFGTLQEAPHLKIEQMQYDLFDMFTALEGILRVSQTTTS